MDIFSLATCAFQRQVVCARSIPSIVRRGPTGLALNEVAAEAGAERAAWMTNLIPADRTTWIAGVLVWAVHRGEVVRAEGTSAPGGEVKCADGQDDAYRRAR